MQLPNRQHRRQGLDEVYEVGMRGLHCQGLRFSQFSDFATRTLILIFVRLSKHVSLLRRRRWPGVRFSGSLGSAVSWRHVRGPTTATLPSSKNHANCRRNPGRSAAGQEQVSPESEHVRCLRLGRRQQHLHHPTREAVEAPKNKNHGPRPPNCGTRPSRTGINRNQVSLGSAIRVLHSSA